MFNFTMKKEGGKQRIEVLIENQPELELYIATLMDDLIEFKPSIAFKLEVYDLCLRSTILEEVAASLKLEPNIPYLLTITVGEDTFRYMLADIKGNALGDGLNLIKTLQPL